MTMPEKVVTSSKDYSWIFRSNSRVYWSFKVLIFSVVLGILFVWGIDYWNNVAIFQKDFVPVKFNSSAHKSLDQFGVSFQSNLSFYETTVDFSQPHEDLASDFVPLSLNLTQQDQFSNVSNFSFQESRPNSGNMEWISVELEKNYTTKLLANWLAPGGEPCRESQTVEVSIPGLDGHDRVELATGKIHEFLFQALDEFGKPHCLGGDYFETDVSGEKWKSRPPVKDLGNGTYVFSLQVHPDFVGKYEFTLILLFRHYQGLKSSPERFSFDKVLRKIPISFVESSVRLLEIGQCQKFDLSRDIWSGRWTRHAKNESCEISNDGRYRCQEPEFPCQQPWCSGSLGVLESNGWTYSTHCSFKLFTGEEAWNCLSNRWIFFWGDSNHCDTIRNMLNFILNMDFEAVPRRFDMNITNLNNPHQTVRITSIFNGNANETANYQGLSSLYNEPYKELLKKYFSGKTVPDTIIMNSGLHDGVFWPSLRRFAKGAEYASTFWSEVLEGVRRRGLPPPEVIFRSTIATGGYARKLAFNPSKMEAFNGVFLEKLRQFGVVTSVIDDFDMTYPWHYDNRCNDGVHYGRAPLKMRWRDGEIGHQYFVDLMLCHVLLNALCGR